MLPRELSLGFSEPRTTTTSGEMPADTTSRWDGRPDAIHDGSPPHLPEVSKEQWSREDGGRVPTTFRDLGGSQTPHEQVPGIGSPVPCPGEALLWQPSMSPAGTCKRDGKRGSLVGSNHEALCGEAPKGQPMIRGETLETVLWRPPKVSQGTTDVIPNNLKAQDQRRGRRKGEGRKTPKTHHHHGR